MKLSKTAPPPLTKDRSNIEQEYEDIAKKANVKLPKKVKEAYIDHSLALYAPPVNLNEPHQNHNHRHVHGLQDSAINQNPFYNSELLTNIKKAGGEKEVKRNQIKIKNAVQKAESLFKETQADILTVLDNRIKKQPGERKKYELMKERIKTIRYVPPPTPPYEARMSCPSPNAFYDISIHSFTLCPQIMELPKASLKTIIAHELSHAIDPCHMRSSRLVVQCSDSLVI